MKLNEYIHKKGNEVLVIQDTYEPDWAEWKIEEWIVDWYKETYGRLPPTWLASDWKKELEE